MLPWLLLLLLFHEKKPSHNPSVETSANIRQILKSNHKLKDKKLLLKGNERTLVKHHKPHKCPCSSEGNSRGIEPHLNVLTTVSNSREETGRRWRAPSTTKVTWKPKNVLLYVREVLDKITTGHFIFVFLFQTLLFTRWVFYSLLHQSSLQTETGGGLTPWAV